MFLSFLLFSVRLNKRERLHGITHDYRIETISLLVVNKRKGSEELSSEGALIIVSN